MNKSSILQKFVKYEIYKVLKEEYNEETGMMISNPNKRYEITYIDSKQTKIMRGIEAISEFGKDEFNEILNGHLPNITAVELEN